jgi:4-hydroxyproline epimerase
VFEAAGEMSADGLEIRPTITGSAFITAEATLLFDERDPFRQGIA